MRFLAYRTGGNRICYEQSMSFRLPIVASRATIENSVSNDLRSTFIDSINVFDCRLSEVFNEYIEYVAKTIQNKGY